MIRVSILGSCVTGDAFAREPEPFREVSYASRTSFISLNSPPLAMSGDALSWKSAYARRRVLADCNKTILSELCNATPDVVVFDFVDERFDLLRCGESYVTQSQPLIESRFPGALGLAVERVPRLSPEAARLWREAAVTVTAEIRRRVPLVRFVLHRAWWAEKFVDGKEVKPFSYSERVESMRMNKQLAEYYSYFERSVPGVYPAEVRECRHAWAQHRWGLAPYHYEPDYYSELIAQIRERVSA